MLTAEHRRNISNAKKDSPRSEEFKKKISAALKENKCSAEHRRKNSEAAKLTWANPFMKLKLTFKFSLSQTCRVMVRFYQYNQRLRKRNKRFNFWAVTGIEIWFQQKKIRCFPVTSSWRVSSLPSTVSTLTSSTEALQCPSCNELWGKYETSLCYHSL